MPAALVPTPGAACTLALGASAHIVIPPAARTPPATKKVVARFPALFASRRVPAAASFGHRLSALQPASLFLPAACNPNAVPRPRPTTPPPALTSPTVFHAPPE